MQVEEKDPERRTIRVAAAEGLQSIAAGKQHLESAKAIADNYDVFFDLCGMVELASVAADLVRDQHAYDSAQLPKPKPISDKNKAKECEDMLIHTGDRAGRINAATTLSRMAEAGDEAASQVILDCNTQQSGAFTGKIINNGEALRRSLPKAF
eukprot:CAMPEP_0179408788 /NCGR_PEP_ID=MMETSP0799-20121207/2307_1 /TAXON_ID=46947 /ORGANISM="Geminigera cryophila, Strain CCMP2564" /LENGTH=152 /DNA_ID=CAMNT_0021180327 /DNA_START=33 /DNA_END=491 /DNA_ORIENTATION=+